MNHLTFHSISITKRPGDSSSGKTRREIFCLRPSEIVAEETPAYDSEHILRTGRRVYKRSDSDNGQDHVAISGVTGQTDRSRGAASVSGVCRLLNGASNPAGVDVDPLKTLLYIDV